MDSSVKSLAVDENGWLRYGRWFLWGILGIVSVVIMGAVVWQGLESSGNPDPLAPGLSHGSVIINTGLLVFREGLEAILVIAAVTASFIGKNKDYRKPVAWGVAASALAIIATWFIVVAIVDSINAPALEVQVMTGILAIVVLLVIMNWFFHKVYWTGWISMHNNRKRELMSKADTLKSQAVWGLVLLGFTAMYREGFEVVLFLQNMRLKVGSGVVLQGVAIGLIFTAVVGVLTFTFNQRLPYKKMLVLTGAFIAFVLVVMVGGTVGDMQMVNWMSTTPMPFTLPEWLDVWFSISADWESMIAQGLTLSLVVGSYLVSRYFTIWLPRKRAGIKAPTI